MSAIRRYLACSFLAFSGGLSLMAQEALQPLVNNPAIGQKTSIQWANQKNANVPLMLPFWDDFSYPGPFPDPARWADNQVFVNAESAVHPKTKGTATFDALDSFGRLYNHLARTNTPQAADYLTSSYIRLDSVFSPQARRLGPADNVALSFYYQPQGMASNPAPQDSLVLQFLHTPGHFATDEQGATIWIEDFWQSVWKATGEDLRSFSNDTFPYFKRAFIPITDPVFFRKDFRFRFINHVSFQAPGGQSEDLEGHHTIWNIDYVSLDANRQSNQVFYNDIAFAANAGSILRAYTSMPWAHYIANPQLHLRSNFNMRISNLDNRTYTYTYRYFIRDEMGNILRNYSGGTSNILPFSSIGYQQYAPHAQPIVIANPLPTAPASQRSFEIVHAIRAGIAGDSRSQNDTVSYVQFFGDYFSYDDGHPETRYFVRGTNPSSALRYVASASDGLKAVRIFFTETPGQEIGSVPFRIMVWKRLYPQEEVLYESDVVFPGLGDGSDRFAEYALSRTIQVSDTFYVGVRQPGQIRDVSRLVNIGFDMNNHAGNHLFYHAGVEWMPSVFQGALMIRPVMSGEKTEESPKKASPNIHTASIFPNPATGSTIQVDAGSGHENHHEDRLMEIYDLFGRRILREAFTGSHNIGNLAKGTYIIRILNHGGSVISTGMFVVIR